MPELAVVGLEELPAAGCLVVATDARQPFALDRLAVDVELLLLHLDDVARQADHALDVVDAVVVGPLEDDDVAPLGLGVLQDLGVGEGDAEAVGELRDEDVVADLQRRDHRARGDLERLDDEGAQEQRHRHGHADRLRVLAHGRLAGEGQVLVHGVVERGDRLAHLLEIVAAERLLDGRDVGPRPRPPWRPGCGSSSSSGSAATP